LQYKPLLRLIWLGPFIMMLGGLFRIYLSKPLVKTREEQSESLYD